MGISVLRSPAAATLADRRHFLHTTYRPSSWTSRPYVLTLPPWRARSAVVGHRVAASRLPERSTRSVFRPAPETKKNGKRKKQGRLAPQRPIDFGKVCECSAEEATKPRNTLTTNPKSERESASCLYLHIHPDCPSSPQVAAPHARLLDELAGFPRAPTSARGACVLSRRSIRRRCSGIPLALSNNCIISACLSPGESYEYPLFPPGACAFLRDARQVSRCPLAIAFETAQHIVVVETLWLNTFDRTLPLEPTLNLRSNHPLIFCPLWLLRTVLDAALRSGVPLHLRNSTILASPATARLPSQ